MGLLGGDRMNERKGWSWAYLAGFAWVAVCGVYLWHGVTS